MHFELLLKVSSNFAMKKSIKTPCPQSLTLESWRTGWFLRPLKLLSICSKMYSELFLQVSSSFAQKKSIKTLHVLEV